MTSPLFADTTIAFGLVGWFVGWLVVLGFLTIVFLAHAQYF